MSADNDHQPLRVLEQLGDEFERAIARDQRPRRGRRRRPTRRPLIAFGVAIVVLLLPGAVIATRELIETEKDPPGFQSEIERAQPRDELAPRLGTARIAATALDPGGGPLWAVVLYRSEAGLVCTRVGRRVDGEVGSFDRNGQFRRFPREEGGNCGDPNAGKGVTLTKSILSDVPITARREPERTIISGVVSPRVDRLLIELPQGRRVVTPTNLGAIIAVYPRAYRRLPITVAYDDGTTTRLLR